MKKASYLLKKRNEVEIAGYKEFSPKNTLAKPSMQKCQKRHAIKYESTAMTK